MAHGTVPEPLRYQEITEANYAEHAARSFSVEHVRPQVTLLHGTCPRCEAKITTPLVPLVFRDDDPADDPADEPADEGEFHVVFCTCDHPHPDRPEGRVGCGAYWAFLL